MAFCIGHLLDQLDELVLAKRISVTNTQFVSTANLLEDRRPVGQQLQIGDGFAVSSVLFKLEDHLVLEAKIEVSPLLIERSLNTLILIGRYISICNK